MLSVYLIQYITDIEVATQIFNRAASKCEGTLTNLAWHTTEIEGQELDAYLSRSPPSKFRLMVATPWPCLFFATALYSPASAFATLSILNLASWYNFWSSSNDVLNRLLSFTSSVPWYLWSRQSAKSKCIRRGIRICNEIDDRRAQGSFMFNE